MPRTSRFTLANKDIKNFFDSSVKKVFSLEELSLILEERRIYWQLPVSTAIETFAQQLIKADILDANRFHFKERVADKVRFWTKDSDIYDIVQSLLPRAYFSHSTALLLHGLTKSKKTIYITSEQSPKGSNMSVSELEQEDVDNAFSKPHRVTNAICTYKGREIVALNGKFTDRLGVVSISGKDVTSIERTLIDITVRPTYAGGVKEVLKIFFTVRDKIDTELVISLLDTLDYTYPYYQSVGFYLENAGYDSSVIKELKSREQFIDFYLANAMEEVAYSSEWRLYYPKGLLK